MLEADSGMAIAGGVGIDTDTDYGNIVNFPHRL
jgi:hypothetical protein